MIVVPALAIAVDIAAFDSLSASFRPKGVGKESNAVTSTAMARAGTTIKTTKNYDNDRGKLRTTGTN